MSNISIKKDFQNGDPLFAEQLNLNFETIEQGVNGGNKIIWQDSDGVVQTSFRGTTEEVNNRPVIDGQTLYNTETGETFLDVGSERISTGAGNVVAVGTQEPTNDATKIWINPEEPLNNIGTEVVNSLDGNEQDMAPSVAAVKDAIDAITVYSTEEKVVGTWIDGKPIYSCGHIGTTSTEEGTILTSGNNIKKIIHTKGHIAYFDGSEGTTIDVEIGKSALDVRELSRLLVINNNLRLDCGELLRDKFFEIVVEYTKTTD